ncbi:MAG: LicD family protein [Clostridia bacterium]
MLNSDQIESKYFTEYRLDDNGIKKVQAKTLELMKIVHKICIENDIKYTLVFGTFLGAVRHKGFIPWDDDIDIAMTRENYKKLLDIINKQKDIHMVCNEKYKDYPRDIPKVEMKGTTVLHLYTGEKCPVPSGVFVDIFLLDYVNSNSKIDKKQNRKYRIYNWLASFSSNYKYVDNAIVEKGKEFKEVKKNYNQRRFIGFFANIFTIKFWVNNAKKVFSKNVPSNYYRTALDQRIMKVNYYENVKLYDFEDTQFFGLEEYDEFLKYCYGDYMKIPEGADRISHCVKELKL